jgi:hypothetical protein
MVLQLIHLDKPRDRLSDLKEQYVNKPGDEPIDRMSDFKDLKEQ